MFVARFGQLFPPMPVALDFEVWMRASGMLAALARDAFADEWDERFDSLVETSAIDGRDYVELSPAGLIFHETFRERFRTQRDRVLPPPAPRKLKPILKADEGHLLAHREPLMGFLQRVTDEILAVVQCRTHYYNPDLPRPTRFRLTRGEVEGVWSDGSVTVKFWVETTATTDGQRAAIVAALNDWLQSMA